jgi:hypothetical protein
VTQKISGFFAIRGPNHAKNVLVRNGPIIAEMFLYPSFDNYRDGSGVYVAPPTARPTGRHYVCVTGFDEAAGCWFVKNSYGTAWGYAGFARIAFGAGAILMPPDAVVTDGQMQAYEILI